MAMGGGGDYATQTANMLPGAGMLGGPVTLTPKAPLGPGIADEMYKTAAQRLDYARQELERGFVERARLQQYLHERELEIELLSGVLNLLEDGFRKRSMDKGTDADAPEDRHAGALRELVNEVHATKQQYAQAQQTQAPPPYWGGGL